MPYKGTQLSKKAIYQCLIVVSMCVMFCRKCYMKLQNECEAENMLVVLQIWCVVLLFESHISKTGPRVKLLCVSNWTKNTMSEISTTVPCCPQAPLSAC